MSQTPDDRPRPTARPRPVPGARPSPRPRVAGSRRERDESAPAVAGGTATAAGPAAEPRARRSARAAGHRPLPTRRPRGRALAAVLAVLCLLAAAAAGALLWQRLDPRHVDASVVPVGDALTFAW